MPQLPSFVPELLAAVGAGLAIIGFVLLVAAGQTRKRALQAELDRLHDEVWELREAAAARDRAEAASEAKSRFLAGVSHEVRTPLNGILGMAELLTGSPLDAEQQTYVAAIQSSGSALAALVDEILDLSKIEAGKVDLLSESFDVVALVEGLAELLAPRAQGKDLEIASRFAAGTPQRVVGDPIRLRQVLLNVAGNAVKFTERGGVGIRVGRDTRGPDWLRFDVLDTGPGVPAGRRSAIFEDFEQADPPTSQLHGGTGLGLAISKRLVERMGGTMWLVAREGAEARSGSLFSIAVPLPADGDSLPRREAPRPEAPRPEAPRPEAARPEAARPEAARPEAPRPEAPLADVRSALIVADSPFQAPFIAEQLMEAGIVVTHLRDLAQARHRLEASPAFDLMIVDCAVGQGEAGALAAMAHDAGTKRTLILFSPFERRSFAHATARGFDGWLVKPVRRQTLFGLLAPARTEAWPPVVPAASPSFNVLLAEDNEINALLATRHLEKLGATVTHAPDGLAALALAESALEADAPFDAVVLDIRMPGLNGLEVARRIRLAETAKKAARSRLVVLSADLHDAERRSASQAGVDAVLGKPMTFAKLEAAFAAPATESGTRAPNLQDEGQADAAVMRFGRVASSTIR